MELTLKRTLCPLVFHLQSASSQLGIWEKFHWQEKADVIGTSKASRIVLLSYHKVSEETLGTLVLAGPCRN